MVRHLLRREFLPGFGLVVLFLLAVFSSSTGAADRRLTQEELFDGEKLLDVQIEIPEGDWKKLGGQTLSFVQAFSKEPVDSTYTYFKANVTVNGTRLSDVEIRKKGFFGSSDADRPSLKVRLSKDKRKLMGGLDKLTLNNNKQDRALSSQYLSYRLFKAAGLPAPRTCLAKVSVNGNSIGVYTHVESVDELFVKRHFGSDTGNLYEGVFPTDFFDDRLQRFSIKTNKKGNQLDDLKAVAAILAKPGDDSVEQLGKLIDLDEFVKFWAIESLISFWDGYSSNQNNYYLYHDPRDNRLHFIPWGTDMTLAPPFFPGAGGGGGGGVKSVMTKGQLSYHLNQNEEFRKKYDATLRKLLDTIWKEDELLAEVDRIAALGKDHLHPQQMGLDQGVATTRKFIQGRREEILAEIKDGPIHIETPPSKPFYMREAGTADGTFAAVWAPKVDKELASKSKATLEVVVDGEPVKLEQLQATSTPSQMRGFGAPPGSPLPPTVVLTGVRTSDKKPMTLTLTFMVADSFTVTDKKGVQVQGALSEGTGGFGFGPGTKSFMGQVVLKSAKQVDGAEIVGSLKGKLYEMRGGFGR